MEKRRRSGANLVSSTFEPTLIIIGLALCLFGWTLYWAGLRLMGAVSGAIAATVLAWIAIILFGGDQWLWIGCVVAAVLGAIAGVFLIKRAHYFLFFLVGAVVGLAAAWVLEAAYRDWIEAHFSGEIGRTLYYAAVTLAGGMLVLLAHRMVVIILTAFGGTVLFALGVPKDYTVWLFLPIFFGSVLVQAGILSALGERGKPDTAKAGEGKAN